MITDYTSLENPQNAAALGISETDRKSLLERKGSLGPVASTTPDLPIGIVTIFNADQINVSWLWSFYSGTKEDILNEAVPHEMIHGAGMRTNNIPGLFFKGHDLNAWPSYNRVIDSCMIPGGRRVF